MSPIDRAMLGIPAPRDASNATSQPSLRDRLLSAAGGLALDREYELAKLVNEAAIALESLDATLLLDAAMLIEDTEENRDHSKAVRVIKALRKIANAAAPGSANGEARSDSLVAAAPTTLPSAIERRLTDDEIAEWAYRHALVDDDKAYVKVSLGPVALKPSLREMIEDARKL